MASQVVSSDFSKYDCDCVVVGAPFYFTHDSQYIIKMITKEECLDFCKFFSSYFTYMTQKGPDGTKLGVGLSQPMDCAGEKSNMNSLLLRVYGCHSVQIRPTQANQYFLVMANVCNFPTVEDENGERTPTGICERKYDLKGSSAGRAEMKPSELQLICEQEVNDGFCSKYDLPTLLDNDYRIEQSYGLGIRIKLQDKKALMKQILRDCVFLASENIMDYSLLVGRWRRTTDIGAGSPLCSDGVT